MSDESYIQSLFADRLGGNQFGKDTKIYKFEKIKRAVYGRNDHNRNIREFFYAIFQGSTISFFFWPGKMFKNFYFRFWRYPLFNQVATDFCRHEIPWQGDDYCGFA